MEAVKPKFKPENVRIGGKGTARRKKKVVHKTAGGDDKKLTAALKKIQMSSMGQVDEVNMIRKDGSVLVFRPAKVSAAYTANMYTVTGPSETRNIADIFTDLAKTAPEAIQKIKDQILAEKQNAERQEIPDDFEAVSIQS